MFAAAEYKLSTTSIPAIARPIGEKPRASSRVSSAGLM
jgi:hypothetical protein